MQFRHLMHVREPSSLIEALGETERPQNLVHFRTRANTHRRRCDMDKAPEICRNWISEAHSAVLILLILLAIDT